MAEDTADAGDATGCSLGPGAAPLEASRLSAPPPAIGADGARKRTYSDMKNASSAAIRCDNGAPHHAMPHHPVSSADAAAVPSANINHERLDSTDDSDGDGDAAINAPPKKRRRRKRRRRAKKVAGCAAGADTGSRAVVPDSAQGAGDVVTVSQHGTSAARTQHPSPVPSAPPCPDTVETPCDGQSMVTSWTRETIPKHLLKYYNQRYSLFSKFDLGVQLDEEGWYSVTPEVVARHISERCAGKVIVDAMCGVGGNTIQFALSCDKVVAIDHDPLKIEMAKHNASTYGVLDKIEFITGNVFEVLPTIKQADVVFASPPWGGPTYLQAESMEMEHLPLDMVKLFQLSQAITPNVAFYMPRNLNPYSVCASLFTGTQGTAKEAVVEFQSLYLNDRYKALMCYFGGLCR
ncbi:hypothetical protein SeMB42_g03829 [Synchytrium endobioticum]|uniref:Trimethylguanosine synthase n=1 Tax=Synchytrium endobioticum TaxID=286115 RepID=A0A507D3J2_9FUNG|nr:hypothetical protein SeLEV6574_g06371 [Synchytrium endobioticum]TPX46004.1 hypothetical protein SeMB42_g03829 [Synchytrium endobioticum]